MNFLNIFNQPKPPSNVKEIEPKAKERVEKYKEMQKANPKKKMFDIIKESRLNEKQIENKKKLGEGNVKNLKEVSKQFVEVSKKLKTKHSQEISKFLEDEGINSSEGALSSSKGKSSGGGIFSCFNIFGPAKASDILKPEAAHYKSFVGKRLEEISEFFNTNEIGKAIRDSSFNVVWGCLTTLYFAEQEMANVLIEDKPKTIQQDWKSCSSEAKSKTNKLFGFVDEKLNPSAVDIKIGGVKLIQVKKNLSNFTFLGMKIPLKW